MKTFKNSKKRKFLDTIFRRSRKETFVNRLKYGQDKEPKYDMEELMEAMVNDEAEKATEIMHKMVERYAKTGKLEL